MAFRLAHFSDIHLTAAPTRMPWRTLLSKHFVGWVNLRLLGRYPFLADAATVTRAFVRDIEEVAPDHVLFTGDATGLSLQIEFAEAREVLAPLIETGRITGIPGNHDLYLRSSVRKGLYETALGSAWETSDLPSPPPIVRLFGDRLALICLKDSRPTALYDSSGVIGSRQLERLGEVLAEDDVRRRVRIVALHYAPLLSTGLPDTRLHGLRDAPAFIDVVNRGEVDLVVHGHIHKRFFIARTPRLAAPLTTPGSLTYRLYDRAYHIYHVGDEGIRLDVRRYEETTNTFVPWPDAPGAGPIARAGSGA